jgi:hypothetical protein
MPHLRIPHSFGYDEEQVIEFLFRHDVLSVAGEGSQEVAGLVVAGD